MSRSAQADADIVALLIQRKASDACCVEPAPMPASRTIAAILGPTLAALAASEALNLGVWARPEPQVVYLNGALLLVAGLAIIRTHNLWTWRWPLLITLVGWVAAAAGLYRMFAPRGMQLHEGPATYALLIVLGAVGLALTSLGWRR